MVQQDLIHLERWSELWQLPFNSSEWHFGHQNPRHQYYLNDQTLDETDREKDLGVIIDDKLKFHAHAGAAKTRANQILGLIKKSYNTRDARTTTIIYKTMVRPHLEYGNIIWGPHYQADIKALESIQRRATKLVFSLKEMDYEERRRELKLPSLVYRRRRGDMIQMYKIMNGLVRMNINALFTRGHSQKLFKYHATKHSRVNSFTPRVIND